MDITLNNYLFSHMYFQYEFNLFMIMINCVDCASPHPFETATPPPHCNSATIKRGGEEAVSFRPAQHTDIL